MRITGRSVDSEKYRYGFNGKEKDESGEFGSLTHYDYGFRIYNPGIGRFLSVDPLADKYPGWNPYNYTLNNPVRFIDPDGRAADDIIYLNSSGKVSKIERTDNPVNLFVMEETSQVLHLNDTKNLDSDISKRNFEVGDRVFFNISNDELASAIDAAGEGTWLNVAFKSYFEADFVMSYLVPNYFGRDGTGQEQVYLEDGLLSIHYVENQHYFKFGDDFRLFNLYDAGNFMWGAWMNDSGFSPSAAKMGSELNEFFMDADADQRAIKAGEIYNQNTQERKK